jgi:D-arabinose 1-dehydrogenase-like Zn-dependent alcohol dehydrogenase
VKKWKEGDRVGGPWHGGHDGTCKSCNKGLFQMCANEAINGVTMDGGCKFQSHSRAHRYAKEEEKNSVLINNVPDSEYCILRTEAAVKISPDVDPIAYAPLLCAGVTTFNGIRKMNIEQGGVVAVQGLGGLGHLAVQYARKMGYRTVALSTSAAKKDFAMELGATDYVDGSKEDTVEALQKMGGADLIIATAPNPQIIGGLVNACGPMGKVLILARKFLFSLIKSPLLILFSCWRRHCSERSNDLEGNLGSWMAIRSRIG